jgi:hypothetical protein
MYDYIYVYCDMLYSTLCRIIEDYAVLYFGSAMFKIGRLLLIAMMCVHLFACVFFRVKKESAASPEDVALFFSSRGVDPNVRKPVRRFLTIVQASQEKFV